MFNNVYKVIHNWELLIDFVEKFFCLTFFDIIQIYFEKKVLKGCRTLAIIGKDRDVEKICRGVKSC